MYRIKTVVGGIKIQIGAWGPGDMCEGKSWSLLPIQAQQDVKDHPVLVAKIRDALKTMKTSEAFAPNVALNSAQIIKNIKLNPVQLGGGFVLHRNKGEPGDGMFLNEGDIFAMSGAGCPVGLMTGGGFVVAFHFNKDSAVDQGALFGNPTRKNISVISAVIDGLSERGVRRNEIAASLQLAIPAWAFRRQFNHPMWGGYNKAFMDFVGRRWPHGIVLQNKNNMLIDLEGLFRDQANEAGVFNVRTENSLEKYPALTYSYDDKKNPIDQDGQELNRRNLLMFKRCS